MRSKLMLGKLLPPGNILVGVKIYCELIAKQEQGYWQAGDGFVFSVVFVCWSRVESPASYAKQQEG